MQVNVLANKNNLAQSESCSDFSTHEMSYPYFSPFAVELCQSVSQYHNGAAPQHQDRDQGRGEQKVWRRGDIIPMSLFQFKMQRIESLNSCNRSFDPGIWGRADRDPWFIETSPSQNISAIIFRAVYGHDHQPPVDYPEQIFLRWSIAWHNESGIRVPTEGLFSVFSFFSSLTSWERTSLLIEWMKCFPTHLQAASWRFAPTECNLKSRIIWHKI